MASTISKQPEFATKFRDISVDPLSYAPLTIDVNVSGRLGNETEIDSDGNVVTGDRRAVAIFVGTGGTLTFLQQGRDRHIPGNYTILKNIPSGTFLPIIATRILISNLSHIHTSTRLTEFSSNLSSVSLDTYSNLEPTTSGSGTGLKVNIHVYNLGFGKKGSIVVSSRTHVDYAVGDTITIPAGWDGGSAPALNYTLTSDNVGTVPATTADDIQIYF